MGPREFQALPSGAADHRITYGQDPNHFGDLRLPAGDGPYPLAILIHGGCFTARFADLRDMAPMAEALKARGIATWNVEYRRLGQAGAGWPGTYLDIARAVDHVRTLAPKYTLDLKRVIIVGHSAGGHLALWAAARSRLERASALFEESPLTLRGVVDLAGPPDMETYAKLAKGACGPDVVESLLGGSAATVPERYAQVSAQRLLPLRIPQVLVWGQRDDIHPIALRDEYVAAATRSGDTVKQLTFPQLGHFEIASPFAPSWPDVESEIRALLSVKK